MSQSANGDLLSQRFCRMDCHFRHYTLRALRRSDRLAQARQGLDGQSSETAVRPVKFSLDPLSPTIPHVSFRGRRPEAGERRPGLLTRATRDTEVGTPATPRPARTKITPANLRPSPVPEPCSASPPLRTAGGGGPGGVNAWVLTCVESGTRRPGKAPKNQP